MADVSRTTPTPIYCCVGCAGRTWWRLAPGPWQCSGCRPWWADAVVVEAIDELPVPAGVRPAIAYADAPVVAAEVAFDCRSAQRFLRAVAAARA